MPGDRLDLSSVPPESGAGEGLRQRAYLGVHFACCGVYARIYRNAEQTAYVGNCPRCTRRVRIEIAPGGTDQRFFTVY
jgi:hypothetical protein